MTVFYTWGFPATGAPVNSLTKRTMADRLAEIYNVKDFGAKGDNSANDTTAIQAAINAALGSSAGGGIVFFPPGTYLTTAVVTGSSSNSKGIIIRGSGKDCTGIVGATISKGAQTYDNLQRIENIVFDAIVATRDGVAIAGCRCGGIDTTGAIGASVRDCYLGGGGNHRADSLTPGCTTGTVGVYLGTGSIATNCRVQGGYEIGYALSGSGASCIACACEVCNIGIRLGWGPGGATQAIGCSIQACQTERNWYGLDLYWCDGCYIASSVITASSGTPSGTGVSPFIDFAPIQTWSWAATAGGTLTITTPAAHNIAAGAQILQITTLPNNTGFIPSGVGSPFILNVTVTNSTQFTYLLTPDPGAFNALDAGKAFWNYPPRYAVRCRVVSNTVVSGLSTGNFYPSLATVDLNYGGASSFNNNVFISTPTQGGWELPTDLRKLSGWKFINAGDGALTGYNTGKPANPFGQLVFADLPGQSGVTQAGPLEGQEYDIVDGSKSGFTPPTAAAFDDTVIGGGNGRYKARYNGSFWKRIG